MLTKEQKNQVVEGIRSDIETAKGIFLTNLIGIPSNDSVAIRKKIRDAQGKIVVTRNTLFQLAGSGTSAEKLLSNLKGPNAVAFAFEEAPQVAKCLKEAKKEHELVDLKGGLLNGEELSASEINALADLPSREEMLGTLLATMMAPVSAFARMLNAIKDECEKQGVETPGELKIESDKG